MSSLRHAVKHSAHPRMRQGNRSSSPALLLRSCGMVAPARMRRFWESYVRSSILPEATRERLAWLRQVLRLN